MSAEASPRNNDTTTPATDPQAPLEVGLVVHTTTNPQDSAVAVSEDCLHASVARGLTTYTCPECHARLEADLDSVLRIILVREDWTEQQLGRVGTMQRFVRTPVSAVKPPECTHSRLARRRGYQGMILLEGNARRDAARELKARMDGEEGQL